jgi:cysteine-rich repeat protein
MCPVVIMVLGLGGCLDGPLEEDPSINSNSQNLNGCDLNGQCTTPGQFCFSHQVGTSGMLWCDVSDPLNKHYTSSCMAGYYCEEGLFDECMAEDVLLRCDLPNNVLVPSTCGDGFVASNEACDELDPPDSGDCVGSCNSTCTIALTGCGDAVTCGTEACDDGDSVSNDGCDANCNLTGCGNGEQTVGEGCDDGNLIDGDGCDANCQPTGCGNGQVADEEMCDDGNGINGDGCDNDCTSSTCGNGIVVFPEQCDDGNNLYGDDCQGNCELPDCGDGITDPNEDCDYGNLNDNEGECTMQCTLADCGDGYVQGEEMCDDGAGNGFGNDCNSDCSLPTCGDGILDPNEECDDGNDANGDGCDANCVEEPDCVEEDPVPCQVGAYGCLQGSSESYCLAAGNVLLECQCFNAGDFNKGTWLEPGADCNTACWNDSGPNPLEACPGVPFTIDADDPPLVLTGTLVGAGDDLDTCFIEDDPSYDGGDHVYHVTLPDTVSAHLFLSDNEFLDANLVIREFVCDEWANNNEWCVGYDEDFEEFYVELPAGEYFFIIDSMGGTSGTYELTATFTTPVCGDGVLNAGEDCDPLTATSYDGCIDPGEPNGCQFEPPNANFDICPGEPIDVPEGFSVLYAVDGYTTNGYTNNYNSDLCNYTGLGVERVFQVTPAVTGDLTVFIGYDDAGVTPVCQQDVNNAQCWDQLIYARSSCDLESSELACADVAWELGEDITFPVTIGVPIYLFVDGYWSEGSSGPFNLHFNLDPAP